MLSALPQSLEECRISRSRQQSPTKNAHRSSLLRMEGFRCMIGRRQRRSCSGQGNRPARRETERRPCCVRIPFLNPHNTVRRRCRRERLSMKTLSARVRQAGTNVKVNLGKQSWPWCQQDLQILEEREEGKDQHLAGQSFPRKHVLTAVNLPS